jgi:hypothetical protein
MSKLNKFVRTLLDDIINIYAHSLMPSVYGVGAASTCFFALLLLKLDGKAQGWNHSFTFFSLCVVAIALIRRMSITRRVFRRKFELLRDLKNRSEIKSYEYNRISLDLLRAYVELNIGPMRLRPSIKNPRPEEAYSPLGGVIIIYVTDGLGMGFALYLIVFLVLANWLKWEAEEIRISKELMVFCFSAMCVAGFAFTGLSRRAFKTKMKFIRELCDDKFITVVQHQVARQCIMGWYTTGPYGLSSENLEE